MGVARKHPIGVRTAWRPCQLELGARNFSMLAQSNQQTWSRSQHSSHPKGTRSLLVGYLPLDHGRAAAWVWIRKYMQ